MEYVFPFVTLVLGIFIGAVYNTWLTRPHLTVWGTGGSQDASGTRFVSVGVSNRPGLIGFRLPHIEIRERIWVQGRLVGMPVDTRTAHDCVAWLTDRETGNHLTILDYIRSDPPSSSMPMGDHRMYRIFERVPGASAYRVVHANPTNPPIEFTGPHRFRLEVRHSHPPRTFKADVNVVDEGPGRLSVQVKRHGHVAGVGI